MNTPDPELAIQHAELERKEAAITAADNTAQLGNYMIDDLAEKLSHLLGQPVASIKREAYANVYHRLRPEQRRGVQKPA